MEARNKKRKAEGKPPLTIEGKPSVENGEAKVIEDEETNKRRKLLQEALALDKEDSESEDEDEKTNSKSKSKSREDEEEDERFVKCQVIYSNYCLLLNSEEESDDEDDTDELLKELERIKRQRAEEKARVEQEQSAQDAAERDMDIATKNPLLNLAAALGQSPAGLNTTAPGTFAVKRRWDDGTQSSHILRRILFDQIIRSNIQEPGHERKGQGFWSFCKRFTAHRISQVSPEPSPCNH